MLITKENEVEIWSDEVDRKKGIKYVVMALIGMFCLLVLVNFNKYDFSFKEKCFIFLGLCTPFYYVLISGILTFLTKGKHLIAKVNAKYIELYQGKEKKQIEINKITKIDLVDFYLAICYKENEKESKYTVKIDEENRKLFINELKKYSDIKVVLKSSKL